MEKKKGDCFRGSGGEKQPRVVVVGRGTVQTHANTHKHAQRLAKTDSRPDAFNKPIISALTDRLSLSHPVCVHVSMRVSVCSAQTLT